MVKKISELILELEDFKKEYGDLPVACLDNDYGDYTPYAHLAIGNYWNEIPPDSKFCSINWKDD